MTGGLPERAPWDGEEVPPDVAVLPDDPPPSLVAVEIDAAWDDHLASRDEDEPLPGELPGGAVWRALYDEATAAAAGAPRDLWNRISEDERGRYCTLAAVGRRQRERREGRPPRPNALPFISAADLVAQTPPVVPWVVRHMLARGALTELDGQAKRAGKTTFLGHLFGAMLSGRPFLGEPTARTRIVLLTEMADTPLRQLLERTGLGDSRDLRILRWTDSRLTRWPDIVADAIAECAEHEAGVLCVDTLPQFAGIRGDSENDAGSALAAMEPLQAASAGGLAVVVTRHERKGGGVVGESGRGSTAFTGTVDIILRLAVPLNPARTTIRELSILSRFDGAPDALMIELGEDGYEYMGTETAVAHSEASVAILDALRSTAIPVGQNEITGMVNAPRITVQRALSELVERGQVVRIGLGHKGHPFMYRLATSDDAQLSAHLPMGSNEQKGGLGAAVLSAHRTPPTGVGSGVGRNSGTSAGGHGSSLSVGDRMGDILRSPEPDVAVLDEPEDLDEPDDLTSFAASVFGDLPTGGVA